MKKVNLYLLKNFITSLLTVTSLILLCIFFVSIFDILNKFRNNIVPFSTILKLALFKLPYLLQELFPFAIFISLLFFFDKLVKNNEIIILFISGFSIWKLLIPIISFVLIISISFITIVQPFGARMLTKQENLAYKAEQGGKRSILVANNGLFLFESRETENRIYTAKSISSEKSTFNDITIIILNQKNKFIKKIESQNAKMQGGKILLDSAAYCTNYKGEDIDCSNKVLDTSLDFKYILSRFSSPENISFWKLGALANNLIKSGIGAEKFVNYYYKLFFRPLYIVSIIFLACCFIRLNNRVHSPFRLIGIGSVIGFIVHSFKEIFSTFLIVNQFSNSVAQLLPVVVLFLISITIIIAKFENN